MRQFYLYCEQCGRKEVVDENPRRFGETHYQYESSACPARSPYLDPETNKTVVPEHIPLMPKFRCKGCGRAVSARKVYAPKKEGKPVEDQADGRETGAP